MNAKSFAYVGGPLVAAVLDPEDVAALSNRRPDLASTVETDWDGADGHTWALIGVDDLRSLSELEFLQLATSEARAGLTPLLSAKTIVDGLANSHFPL